MPRKLRLCALVLCIALCAALVPGASASTIILTAVNDEFLPLASSTMPTRRSGEWYVPYSVFRSACIIHHADQTQR